MTRYEYTAIPAPFRTEKSKDSKTVSDRFADALTTELNRMAANGWEYIRADVLPSEERSGLTGKTTVYHNLLIFRKEVELRNSRKAQTQAKQAAPVAQTQPVEQPAAPSTPAKEPEVIADSDEK